MSSSKRRSGPAGLIDDFAATPDPKRRKRNDDTHYPDFETRETTTELGLKLVRQLKISKDKSGRNVAVHFIDLPSRADYPDYYQQIAMPLSLNMIEQRLENREYETMEQLESDLKRMVQNAKDYNHSKSPIFEDAERIRKALSNFMPKHNPAYLRPDYRAYPTPIPQDLLDRQRASSAVSEAHTPTEKVKLVFSRSRRSEATPATLTRKDLKQDYLNFLKELSEQEDAINFEERVSKKDYPDYYKVIKKPTSISDVRALVESDAIPDWDTLAKEVRLIWDNAKEYNQEGSDIYIMAEKLETWSEQRMQSLGAAPRRNLKLSLSQPKPKALRLTMGSSTPTPTLVGGTIDSESLRRQKEETGQALSRARRASSRHAQANGSTPVPPTATPSVRRSVSQVSQGAEVTEQPDIVMAEATANGTATPQPQEVIPKASQTPAPAPVQLPTPVREVDTPAPGVALTNGTRGYEPPGSRPAPHSADGTSPVPFERRFRDPGKGLESALIGSVIFKTNPTLPNDPKWQLVRRASPVRTQTTGFISLPFNYRDIRIIPVTTPELKSRRRHRILVIHNTQVYREPNSPFPGAYDVRLYPGENVLSVEVLADLRDGERRDAPPQLQFDFEKCTLIVNLGSRP
ncbi:hypothetical protein HRR83_008335 [Exophiala dermatitidis]|uniref:Bromo domain-containing protein n=1 Tax=Exophiala dermatitidis (strain ATCC 34100 / CBS 525.76 / NIH/UT8656) TaxID=858893 RepID=H6C585_EXODN|nr:uncharacterized protein HMPREF1120_07779 [Exophiala dermatitidis NIH/UT8656]KAJ4507053.1 hypothetical protein HRR73_007874 [Exophiala dermatitidis]EHY59797.1 hypothetical protein HMPREF1120_07779 [Exophiala dermatitidis NIH/UT8656]KAJ4507649.1 hypothetical protein HRR74_007976 [Exophiala dermatitidis]KAJ4533049.1 hypothetical protein HRR76_008019 [Exophiala dermatitidis]KAJ4560670.1 hypothetical protein HRR79_007793 [Exophiala dermatitidis]